MNLRIEIVILCALNLCLLSMPPTGGCFGAELARKAIELPDFPEGAAYVLSRVSNEELINVERSEPVYAAILTRDGLDPILRMEAVIELAAIRKTDEPTQILEGIRTIDDGESEPTSVHNDLARFITGSPVHALQTHRDSFLELARSGRQAGVRRIGYAALVTADDALDTALSVARETKGGLADLLGSVGILQRPELRTEFFHVVEPLLRPTTTREVLRPAILASAMIAGHESEAFDTLASFIRARIEPNTSIQALLRLPAIHWPRDHISDLADSVVQHAVETAPEERNSEPFKRMLRLAEEMANLLSEPQARLIRAKLGSLGIRVVTLRAVPQLLLYDKKHIVVQAGEPVEITFENSGIMPHNLVITVPGALQEVGIAATLMINDPIGWDGRKFVPKSEKVLYATRLVMPGESANLNFTAPESVGEYPYVCTFPGHWVQMNGVMNVVLDVNSWMARNPGKATVSGSVTNSE